MDGVGDVCDYALFDFDKYGDMNYGAVDDGQYPVSERFVLILEYLFIRG